MASGSYSDLVNRCRVLLSDRDAPYRWEDGELLVWLNEARLKLWQFRPDAFYVNKIVTREPAKITSGTASVDVLGPYETFIVNYIVARAMGQDAEHAANMATSQYYTGMAASDLK